MEKLLAEIKNKAWIVNGIFVKPEYADKLGEKGNKPADLIGQDVVLLKDVLAVLKDKVILDRKHGGDLIHFLKARESDIDLDIENFGELQDIKKELLAEPKP